MVHQHNFKGYSIGSKVDCQIEGFTPNIGAKQDRSDLLAMEWESV